MDEIANYREVINSSRSSLEALTKDKIDLMKKNQDLVQQLKNIAIECEEKSNGNNNNNGNDNDNLATLLSNVKSYNELESLWVQAKRPPFCSHVQEKENTLVVDITMQGINPFRIEIYRENDIVSDEIRRYGHWDKAKLDSFQTILRDYSTKSGIPLHDLTFVDIGSNIGWFTLSMASLGVNVMAFEPMTSNNDMIQRSLCMESNVATGLSGRVQLFKNGLGPKEESCFVVSGDINEGDGHTLCGEKESDIHVQPGYSIRGKIVTKRLDDIASTEGKTVVLVKMDVEGFESHVVEGGRDFLLNSNIPYIVSEFVPEWMTKYGGDPERMMKRFYDAGYKVKRNGISLTREEALDMKQYGLATDVIFELV